MQSLPSAADAAANGGDLNASRIKKRCWAFHVIPALCQSAALCGGWEAGIQSRINRFKSILQTYHRILSPFWNTLCLGFNLKGEPIVETPEQVFKDFIDTKLASLYIESYVISKK